MAVAVAVMGVLCGKKAFLYPPASEPRSELVRRLTCATRYSRTKLRVLDALPLISNVTLPSTVPHTPSPAFLSWPVMQGSRAFTLPVHENEAIDHPDATSASPPSGNRNWLNGKAGLRKWGCEA